MKKKFLSVVLLLICAFACVFSLVACGGNGPSGKTDTDKAKQNAEFVEYRKAVVSVLKDNGIFVNDYDNVTDGKKSKAAYTGVALASSRSNPVNSKSNVNIADLIVKQEYLQNPKDYEFTKNQLYGINLRISLCIGDGMATYFNEKQFFGITAKMDATYFKVLNSNNVYNVQGFTPIGEGYPEELYDNIVLTYNSGNDYSFAFAEWRNENDVFFGYGNSEHELFVIKYEVADSPDGQQNAINLDVIYSPDGEMYYATGDAQVVTACFDQIKSAIPSDVSKFRALQSEVKYTFTESQFSVLHDKYFKDIQNSTAPQKKGVQTEDINGKKVATAYIADREDKAVITSDIEYIRDQFAIEDNDGTVKSLYIPSSVKFVVDNDGNIIDLADPDNILRIEHRVGNIDSESPLNAVEVQNGSPLFKSGSGHLYSKGGRLLYVADIAMQGLDYDILSFYDLDFSDYKNLLNNFKASGSLSLNLEELGGKENVDFNLQKLIKLLKLSELNIEGNGGLGIEELPVTRDMTINIRDLGNEGYVGVNMVNSSSTKYNVTVNITDFDKSQFISVVPKQPEKTADDWEMTFVPNDKIFTTVNVDMDETYFNMFCKDRIETDKANSKIVLQPSTESAPNGFYINDINEENNCITLRLNEDVSDGTYTVPNTLLGYKVDRVMLDLNSLKNKSVKITVNKEILIWFVITENGIDFSNENFVIKSDGTFEELKEKMFGFSGYENTDIVFTAQCSDKTDLMKLGWKYSDDNPGNFAYKTTIAFKGTSQKIPVREGEDLYDVNLVKYFAIDATNVYYILGGETAQCLTFEDYGEGNTGLWVRVPSDRDSEYTLLEVQSGIREYRLTDEKENYDISLTARFSAENITGDNIVITSGTVLGRPIFIPDNGGEKDIPTDITDEQRFDFLQGVRCELFREFDLPLGEDESNTSSIRVKITLDENGGLKLVYCEQIDTYEVNITLCDGSQLHQNLLWGEKIAFDCETWKIESGYAYYYEYSNGNGSWRDYLDTECAYLDISTDNYNITLHKVSADQEKTFDLTGDGYAVSGRVSVYYSADDKQHYIQITSDSTTVNGQTVNAYQNIAAVYSTKMQIARVDTADFDYDISDSEYIHITETLTLNLIWEIDNDGNITVTAAELKNNISIAYSPFSISSNSVSWSLVITDNFAEILYSVGGDIVAVKECNVSELSDGDRNKAVIAEHTVSDGNDGWQIERYLIYIDVETADNGEVVINGVSYKKEIVPTV